MRLYSELVLSLGIGILSQACCSESEELDVGFQTDLSRYGRVRGADCSCLLQNYRLKFWRGYAVASIYCHAAVW
jgi:hypothetical protein